MLLVLGALTYEVIWLSTHIYIDQVGFDLRTDGKPLGRTVLNWMEIDY